MSDPRSDWLADTAQTLGTILTRASCTALSRSASCWRSWYGDVGLQWLGGDSHSGLAVWVLIFPAPVAATLPRLEVAHQSTAA